MYFSCIGNHMSILLSTQHQTVPCPAASTSTTHPNSTKTKSKPCILSQHVLRARFRQRCGRFQPLHWEKGRGWSVGRTGWRECCQAVEGAPSLTVVYDSLSPICDTATAWHAARSAWREVVARFTNLDCRLSCSVIVARLASACARVVQGRVRDARLTHH